MPAGDAKAQAATGQRDEKRRGQREEKEGEEAGDTETRGERTMLITSRESVSHVGDIWRSRGKSHVTRVTVLETLTRPWTLQRNFH